MSDGNPERRNLVLLSMAIIVFYIADGEIIDNSLRLQFINIQFNDFQVLSYVIWAILLWFLFRYRLTTLGSFDKEFKNEFNQISSGHPILIFYIKIFLNDYTANENSNGKPISGINYSRNAQRGGYRYIYNITHNTSTEDGVQNSFPIKGALAWIVLILIGMHTAIIRPSFSAYIVPYLLFLTAATSPLLF